jgi:LacI family gluconate utilization system Gnt-I transcriptional repressor
MRERTSVTVVDVARVAGVSPMTVSRVLAERDGVAPDTAERVLKAVGLLGYVRNRLAGGLRSRRSHLVAAIVPTLAGPVFLESIDSLNTELGARGYRLIVGQTGYAATQEQALVADLIGRRPDAIVLTGTMHAPEARRLVSSAGIPVLEIWDLASDPIDMLIGFSHEEVGTAVCTYLHQRARRGLAVIGADDARSRRRWDAFAKQASRFGLAAPPVHFVPAPARLGDGRRALRALMEQAPQTDAVFCSSDMLAAGVLIEAAALRLPVPERLSVVGFGDLNFAADLEPGLTSVRVDAQRIGSLAAAAIVGRLHGEPPAQRVVDVGFNIVQRGTA